MLLAVGLVAFGLTDLVTTINRSWDESGDALLTAIGYVVIALAVFDVAKYFIEEEVSPRVGILTAAEQRRVITKFISTIVIAVFIEGLVIVIKVSKLDVDKMLYPTALLATAALIVIALGVYQRLNVEMERHEAADVDKA